MIAVFAISHTHIKINSLVASVFYSEKEINTQYYNNYFDRNLPIESQYESQFVVKKKTQIIRVLSTGQLANKLSSIGNNDNLDKEEPYDLNNNDLFKNYNIYKSVTPSKYFDYYEIYDYNFFTNLFIKHYIFSKQINLLEHVFIFDTLD